jgi:subtilisin family serine protease
VTRLSKHRALLALGLSAILGTALAGSAGASQGPGANPELAAVSRVAQAGAPYVPGEVVVGFRQGAGVAAQGRTLRARGLTAVRGLGAPGVKLLRLPAGASVQATVASLERDPDVLYAEPNYLYHTQATLPNDPQFGTLWGLNQVSDKDIDAPEAWDVTTGKKSIVVAVIDTGIAYDHPDLAPNMWQNPGEAIDGKDNDGNGKVDDNLGWDFVNNDRRPLDFNEHGTHVAGTIGARGNNGVGVTGVNWQVSLMALRAGDAYGSFTNAAVAAAFNYACKEGARVVNGSFGGPGASSAQQSAINSAACAKTLFVFAAGNGGSDGIGDNNDVVVSGQTPTYPCSYPSARIICVAATNQSDALTSFSNFGLTSVDIAAPGAAINSTVPLWSEIAGFFADPGFEDGAGFATRWGNVQNFGAGATTWGRTTTAAASGAASITDSPAGNYVANTASTIRNLGPINLASPARDGCQLDYDIRLATQYGKDFYFLLAGTSTSAENMLIMHGATGSTGGVFVQLSDPLNGLGERSDISILDRKAAGYIRFALDADNDGVVGDGVYLDNLELWCLVANGADYDSFNGTSMASPHVAGVAALVLAKNHQLTTAQLRNAILSSGDPVGALATKVATGRRLNAFNALNAVGLPDLTPPNTKITGMARSGQNRTFRFASTEAGSTFQCKLDGGPWTKCGNGKTYRNLRRGRHLFQVRASDKFGNRDATPAKKQFLV